MSPQTSSSAIDIDLLLNQSQVAKILGMTEKFLEARRTRGGGIPFCKIGRLVRYRRADVDIWIQGQRRVSTSGAAPR